MGVRTVVQSAANAINATDYQTVQAHLGSAPTNGNLLIAIATLYDGNGAPSPSTGWGVVTAATSHVSGAVCYVALYYKYAGAGESTTQTPEANARQLWGLSMWEISGVTGTWATDFKAANLNANAGGTYNSGSGTTGTISGFNTNSANELVLASLQAWNGATEPTAITETGISPTCSNLTNASPNYAGVFGTYAAAYTSTFGEIATNATAISGTFTTSQTCFDIQYGIVELTSAASSSTETGTAALALSGVAFSSTVVGKESATAALALAGVRFAGTAYRKESATVSLALNGVTIAAFASDLSAVPKLRQFHVFG